MNKHTFLAIAYLLASGFALAQTPAQNAIAPTVTGQPGRVAERHPQAWCLAGIERERMDYAGAVDQGLKTGRIDPKERAALEKILGDLMALETKAKMDRSISTDECKAIYKRIVAENSGLQMRMRARPFISAAAPAAGGK